LFRRCARLLPLFPCRPHHRPSRRGLLPPRWWPRRRQVLHPSRALRSPSSLQGELRWSSRRRHPRPRRVRLRLRPQPDQPQLPFRRRTLLPRLRRCLLRLRQCLPHRHPSPQPPRPLLRLPRRPLPRWLSKLLLRLPRSWPGRFKNRLRRSSRFPLRQKCQSSWQRQRLNRLRRLLPLNRPPSEQFPSLLRLPPRLHNAGWSCPRPVLVRSTKLPSSFRWQLLPRQAPRPLQEPASSAVGPFLIAGPRALPAARAVFNAHRAARPARDNSPAARGPSTRPVPIHAGSPAHPAAPALRLAVPASGRGPALERRAPAASVPVQADSAPAVQLLRPRPRPRERSVPVPPGAAADASSTPRPKKVR
jgi:hypothetical protein